MSRRRKEPILSYVTENDEKKNPVTNGLMRKQNQGQIKNSNAFSTIELINKSLGDFLFQLICVFLSIIEILKGI